MKDNFARCLALSKASEGGFSNNAHDDGGPTMHGVTLVEYQRRHPGASVADLKAITDAEVQTIYHDDYFVTVHGDELPIGLDYSVFDTSLNSGPGRAAKILQEALGVTADGVIGPKTLAAVAARDPRQVITDFNAARLAFMKVAKNDAGELLWTSFGRGWQTRVDNVLRDSLAMVDAPAVAPPAPAQPSPVILPPTPVKPQPDDPGPDPVPRAPAPGGFWAGLVAFILSLFGRKRP